MVTGKQRTAAAHSTLWSPSPPQIILFMKGSGLLLITRLEDKPKEYARPEEEQTPPSVNIPECALSHMLLPPKRLCQGANLTKL